MFYVEGAGLAGPLNAEPLTGPPGRLALVGAKRGQLVDETRQELPKANLTPVDDAERRSHSGAASEAVCAHAVTGPCECTIA